MIIWGALQIQDRSRPVVSAASVIGCAIDATGLDSGDQSWICNTALKATLCKSQSTSAVLNWGMIIDPGVWSKVSRYKTRRQKCRSTLRGAYQPSWSTITVMWLKLKWMEVSRLECELHKQLIRDVCCKFCKDPSNSYYSAPQSGCICYGKSVCLSVTLRYCVKTSTDGCGLHHRVAHCL